MLSRSARRSAITLAAFACVGGGCGSPEDPFTVGPAHAAVTGVVTTSAGARIAATTVNIACAGGGSAMRVTTDSMGRYLANLSSGPDPFDGTSGSLLCQFTEPAAAIARLRVDTALGFVRGPVLVTLQLVDLHEP
jgi:hypothetical protein